MFRTFQVFALAGALALAACANQPDEPAGPPPASLAALQEAHDWQWEAGKDLDAAWKRGVTALLRSMSRPDAIKAIEEAGFACIYGEAHETYPDPMAVCSRSFATRRCQMDWEISSTAKDGRVDTVDGEFRRDCVGVVDDWPHDVKSAIDDQLAPPNLPE